MSDLINRQDAIRTYQDVCSGVACYECQTKEDDGTCKLEKWLKNLPSAEPNRDMIHLQKEQAYMQGWVDGQKALREVSPAEWKGKWIRTVLGATSGYGTTVMYQCSKCGKMAMSEYHYCPNCGADI